jgi:hypothetical protein
VLLYIINTIRYRDLFVKRNIYSMHRNSCTRESQDISVCLTLHKKHITCLLMRLHVPPEGFRPAALCYKFLALISAARYWYRFSKGKVNKKCIFINIKRTEIPQRNNSSRVYYILFRFSCNIVSRMLVTMLAGISNNDI